MTERDNVRLENTGVTHAQTLTIGLNKTRCGLWYHRLPSMQLERYPRGVETNDAIDTTVRI